MEKTIVGRFLRGRPSSAPTLAHLRVRAGLPARYRATVADRWGPPVGAVFPQSPCSAPACSRRPNSRHHPTPQGWPRVHLPP
jgi:hypothetical protein